MPSAPLIHPKSLAAIMPQHSRTHTPPTPHLPTVRATDGDGHLCIERHRRMKKQQQAAPEYTTDADGQQLVHIALANSNQRATLYAEDYQRLMDAGFSPSWQYTRNKSGSAYVTVGACTHKGVDCLVPFSRLVAMAEAGQMVRYRDGNPLNMRAANLKLETGTARYSAADWYPCTTALRSAGVTPKPEAWREGSRRPRKPRKTCSAHVETTECAAEISVAPSNSWLIALAPPGTRVNDCAPRSVTRSNRSLHHPTHTHSQHHSERS